MILVQKPLSLTPAHSPLHTHRRHPSAPPTVVVHPTRTPGLLTLSKPPRPPPQRQNPNQRQTLPKSKSTSVVGEPLLKPPAEITNSKKSRANAVPATPSPQPRGRGQVMHPKDKVQTQSRSPSYPSVHGRQGRQPSPPIPQSQLHQIPSQVEVAVIHSINSTNLFDPFLDNDSSLSSNPPSPTLPVNSSGKSVIRGQQPNLPSPMLSSLHSEAIPVPAPTRRRTSNISRSDPLPSRQRPRPISAHPSTFQSFPICDDMNVSNDAAVPTTPPPTRRHYDNGLQTAPISAHTPGAFPFNSIGSRSPHPPAVGKKGTRKHRRAPSEGVFHMSSDEDLSSGSGGIVLNPNVQALFGLVNSAKPSSKTPSSFSTPIRSIPPYKRDSASPSNGLLCKEKLLERQAAQKVDGYFASSMFQNSPSPDELPDPLLF